MSSRSYFLLLKDLRDLEENEYTGITAFPVSEDKLKWEASIEGLKDTIWHGIYFPLTINFTAEYNLVPPVVKFKRIPFHPNVDQHTGRPCIDFLDDPRKWKTSYTLSSILLTLQVMLSNPVLENPVNLQAAQTLVENETVYKLIVQKLFREKLSLDKDSSSDLSKDSNKLIRYAAAKAQYTRETKTPHKAQYQSSRIYPSPVSDSPSETEVVLKIHEAEEWEDDGEHIHEPGEEEVEELVNWTHTLNSDTLDV
ncbi:Ubiquitin-conjugating enzyme E2 U [Myotis brandtii]|uniref:Ubiquitin-conjugating enzyme E2 U n=1 Tax=Myotis brandtii TaxID=109478 RepID=S7Q2E2_MYOBR|nr:Ubiquitin-conjugating enzyme E2 U [Myotis brandtii]